MDELIYLLIKLIAGMFGGEDKPAQGPGRPGGPGWPGGGAKLPLRPPMTPGRPAGRPPQPARPTQASGPMQTKTILAKMPPARVAARAPVAAPVAVPRPPMAPPKSIAPVPPPRTPGVKVDAVAIRRWLRPTSLHDQFILSEIFQPPISMRPPQ